MRKQREEQIRQARDGTFNQRRYFENSEAHRKDAANKARLRIDWDVRDNIVISQIKDKIGAEAVFATTTGDRKAATVHFR